MYLLQINFRVSISRHAYEEQCVPVAQATAEFPGLLWEAWIFNDESSTAGGIYLFDTEDALDCFLHSSIVRGMKESPAFSEISVNRFEVLPELSRMTRFAMGEGKTEAGVVSTAPDDAIEL